MCWSKNKWFTCLPFHFDLVFSNLCESNLRFSNPLPPPRHSLLAQFKSLPNGDRSTFTGSTSQSSFPMFSEALKTNLTSVGGFNPSEKYYIVKMGIFPNNRGENNKNIWNHHLAEDVRWFFWGITGTGLFTGLMLRYWCCIYGPKSGSSKDIRSSSGRPLDFESENVLSYKSSPTWKKLICFKKTIHR